MKIEKDTVVTLKYKVADGAGKVLEESKEPMAYLHGGYGNTFQKIEDALAGQEVGFATVVQLEPKDAFGERNEELQTSIPKSQFPPGVKVGGQLELQSNDGQSHIFTVVKIKGDQVLLDGNHPMAGKSMVFHLKVMEVRAAVAEEIAHGHVHGAHGHHH